MILYVPSPWIDDSGFVLMSLAVATLISFSISRLDFHGRKDISKLSWPLRLQSDFRLFIIVTIIRKDAAMIRGYINIYWLLIT